MAKSVKTDKPKEHRLTTVRTKTLENRTNFKILESQEHESA